jgi:phosphatidylglycerol---prolipoprotein diacylglyceryl transferase
MIGVIVYPLLAVTSLVLSAYAWEKLTLSAAQPTSKQRSVIYFGCIVGTALGAKLGFVFAEGFSIAVDPGLTASERLMQLMAGKTVTGALLGAYFGVEYAKQRVAYRSATGDTFALIAPCSIALSRLGCLVQGCCVGRPMQPGPLTITDHEGVARWPAVPFELAFNLCFVVFVLCVAQRRKRSNGRLLEGQLFHVYLISYGVFRFAHELLRDTPRWYGPWSGYHALALALAVLGAWGFARRWKSSSIATSTVRR